MAESRKRRIEDLLNKIRIEEAATVEELSRYFDVSTATIRRDIKALEQEHHIIRTVGGGIVYQKDSGGAASSQPTIPFIDEKIRIAEYCTEIVHDRDEILIGPGTTTFLAGKILSGISDRRFRIITNSLDLALETTSVPNIQTVILGGEVHDKHSVGFETHMDYFHSCHKQHKLLLSVDGVDIANGLTLFDSRFLGMVKKMIGVSTEIVLVADSSKLGRVRFNHVAGLEVVTLFVTDTNAADDFCSEVDRRGIKTVRV